MVQMVRSAPSVAMGEVVFVNIDGNKGNLTGTIIFFMAVKYGREHPDIRY